MNADLVHSLICILATIVILVCVVIVLHHNRSFAIKGVVSYIALLATFVAGNVFFVIQCLTKNEASALLAFKMQMIITLFTIAFYIMFFRQSLTGKRINIWYLAGGAAASAAYTVLVLINPKSLMISSYGFEEYGGGAMQFEITFAPLFVVFQAAIYGFFMYWVVRIIIAGVKRQLLRKQTLIMASSVVVPVIANVLFLAHVFFYDYTNIIFAFSAMMLTYCLTQFGIKDPVVYLKNNLMSMLSDPFFILTSDGAVEYANPAAERLSGRTLSYLKGKKLFEINAGFPVEINANVSIVDLVSDDPSSYKLSVIALNNQSGRFCGMMVMLHDITEQKIASEQLKYLTTFDKVTNLINADTFIEIVENYKNNSPSGLDRTAFLAIAVDNVEYLKGIANIEQKNELLRQIVEFISSVIDENYCFSRFGESEFYIFSNGRPLPLSDMRQKLEGVRQKVFTISGISFNIDFCIGAYVADSSDISAKEAVDRAAYVLRSAMSGSKNFQIYDFNMSQQHELKRNLIGSLNTINYAQDFYMEFQPIVDIRSNKVVAAEALLRWRHPIYGNLSPAVFIPIFESVNEMDKLGYVIIEKVCDALKAWSGILDDDFKMSLNVSKKQLDNPALIEDIKKIIAAKRISPQLLDFEITETAASRTPEFVKNFCSRIKALGSSVSMDDFGSGDTSIAYITEFGVNKLKLDISISDNAHIDKKRGIVVKSLLQMCDSLKIPVVVEHVESIDALESLKKQGFSLIQGYIFSRPLPSYAFISFYKDFNGKKENSIKK